MLSSSTCPHIFYMRHMIHVDLAVLPKTVSANNSTFYQEILEIYACNYTVTYNQQNHGAVPCDRQQILLFSDGFQYKLANPQRPHKHKKMTLNCVCVIMSLYCVWGLKFLKSTYLFECQDCIASLCTVSRVNPKIMRIFVSVGSHF